jgi:predicted ATPase
MLTHIEIDGFKTFQNFTLDLSPFLAILGPNASGKSNLFDVVRLLSRLAEYDLRTAFSGLRGEPTDLFRRLPGGAPGDRISIAAEVLLDPEVTDPWGTRVELVHTRFRYSVEIERRADDDGIERLYVIDESAVPILAGKDRESAGFQRWVTPELRESRLRYRRRSPLLTTSRKAGRDVFVIHNDGVLGRPRPATAAEATVLSSITSAEFKHLFALREEMRSWRFLQLDPAAVRTPSPAFASDRLQPDGGNLAFVLHQIDVATGDRSGAASALADISADLAHIIPGLRDVEVRQNVENRRWEIWFRTVEESPYPASVASDGTLRVLALLAALYDPARPGMICFEEPENGVQPTRLRDLVRYLRELVQEQLGVANADEPLTQLLLATHSPVVLTALGNDDVVFTDMVSAVEPAQSTVLRRTRMRPVRSPIDGQQSLDVTEEFAFDFEVSRFAAAVRLES